MILDELPAVRALPPDKQWQLLDELWRELADAANGEPADPATVALLESRDAEYQADPSAVRTWAEVREHLARHKDARNSGG